MNISYKNLMGTKPFRNRFDKINGYIRGYDGTKFVILFGGEKWDFIYNRIRYLTGVNSDITYVISDKYAKIEVDSYDSLIHLILLTFYNIIILIKSFFNKDKNNCYYNISLTIANKFLYKL